MSGTAYWEEGGSPAARGCGLKRGIYLDGVVLDCPSSGALRQFEVFVTGGSGSVAVSDYAAFRWQIAQPVLETLSDKFHVSAAAAVLDGCDALYTIRANSHQPSTILVSTGTRLPAHVTAMGRVLLAHLEPGRLNEVLKQISFRSLTEKSVSNATQLRKLLAQVRQEGYSIVDEEMLFGLRAIAVPLWNKRGEVVASINACGNRRSLEITYLKESVLPALTESANRITQLLPA